MKNFEFYNPTRIVFGEGTIARLSDLVRPDTRVLMCYGGGSIKRNGVYDQVVAALEGTVVIEFGGIEANPDFDTLMKAVALGRSEDVDFVLAVGGGSVIDGVKFVAAAIPFEGNSPWEIVTGTHDVKVGEALPFGAVLTLPATGSEFNPTSVISRRATDEKFGWRSEAVFPQFSILDPTTTYSLSEKQVRNGIVDAYMHVMEQYLTYPAGGVLQDHQAEAILMTLQEIADDALASPPDYNARANLMWTASNALNKLINKGVPEDWATHMIGHELTAFYGLAHAETLAVILPHLYRAKKDQKLEKLAQYGRRVWGLTGADAAVADEAIDKLSDFFHSIGMPTSLASYEVDLEEAAEKVRARFEDRGVVLGEHNDITPNVVAAIIKMSN
ncbi:iron-containing alcohol dehydrogenase [bacterium]|nr:iron-containing alcohol dehydrogenase [bacterium]